MIQSGVRKRPDADVLLRRRLGLLEQIESLGSISKAAKAVGLTYKAAWDAVSVLNAAFGAPLVESAVGGAGGGGARLTAEGARRLAVYRRRVSLRTSARNQFHGTVSRVKRGAVNCEIALALPGGDELTAVITEDSLEELGLRKGSEAFALVKASWVLLAAGTRAPRLSSANVFEGRIEALREGPVSCEAVVRLPGGSPLIAVVTRESAKDLRLSPGARVWAVVNPSSVIVGVHA